MNDKKQIEETIKIVDEMASSLCRYHDLHSNGHSCLTCWRRTTNCNTYPILFRLAELNYRKQSELSPCDVCQFNIASGSDGKPCTFCPALMKGGAE